MNRQEMIAISSSIVSLSSRLHILSKVQPDAERFWNLAEQLSEERRYLLESANGTERKIAIVESIVHDAFEHAPELRQLCMAKYLWQILDPNARAVFRSTFKSPRTVQGLEKLVQYVDYLEKNGVIDYRSERTNGFPIEKSKASNLLCIWLIDVREE